MKRIVGLKSRTSSKGNNNPRGINDIVESTDSKARELDAKVAQCDEELRKISQQLKAVGGASNKKFLQDKAKTILLRKKRFEQQADQMKDKSFNLDSLGMTLNTAQDAVVVAGVMKNATKTLKKQLKKVDLDKVEDVQDELGDLIELTDEVQASIGKSYTIPVDIDEDELNAQLELLGDEIVADNDGSYIDEALSAPSPRPPSRNSRDNNRPPSRPSAVEVDDYGLPILPSASKNVHSED